MRYSSTLIVSIVIAGCAGVEPAAEDAAPRVERVERRADGLPYFVAGALGKVAPQIDDARALEPVLPGIASMFEVAAHELAPVGLQRDRLGMTHVRYVQQRAGLRVVGGDLVVHVGADGVVRSVNGTARDQLPSARPDVARDAAEAIAQRDPRTTARATELVYVIATADDRAYLAWEIEVAAGDLLVERTYVDAHGGDIVDRRPEIFTARNRTIFDGNGGTYPFVTTQTQVGTEGQPPTDMVALAAYTNTGLTYDCYDELFQRDSYDGSGGTLKSLVHVKFYTPQGATGNNAAWAGNQMVYGDGDGMLMRPLALSLDVTAHELTHGVTSATAKLAYQNEPGALNEGMSDILGAVCEAWADGAVSADTWLIGEDVFTPNTDGDALRYMHSPTLDASLYPPQLGGSRDYYPERFQGTEDNGGVHLNSGIPNLAFHLLVAGGKHPRDKTSFMVPAIGIAKAGAIFERALTGGYMTANTNLAQARTATEQVADELFPGTRTAVGMAWAAVGVGTPPDPDTQPPSVAITSPANGAAVPPGFEVTVDATDDRGVLRVELAIDGAVVGTATAAPYTFATDAALPGGHHTLRATAYDAFNQATDTIEIDVLAACTADEQCPDGHTCEAGTCQPGGNPADGDDPAGCGCAADPEPGSWLLVGVVAALWCRRRSPRRRRHQAAA